mgnify:CR=1 FL=1
MEAPPRTKLKRQKSEEEEIIRQNILQYEQENEEDIMFTPKLADDEEEQKEDLRYAGMRDATQYSRKDIAENDGAIDKRGKRSLRKIFGDKVLGNVLAEKVFAAYHKRVYGVDIARTAKGAVNKKELKDNVMKDYIMQLNNDQITMSGLQAVDVAQLKGKAEMIKAQQKVMPSLLNLVISKDTVVVDIAPNEEEQKDFATRKGFGVNKKVAQKEMGTQLGLKDLGLSDNQISQLSGQGDLENLDPARHNLIGGNPEVKNILKREADNIQEGVFGDNMIRAVNAGLTGLEANPLIEVAQNPYKLATNEDIVDEARKFGEPKFAGPILEQDKMLNGPDDEFRHADPNDDRELMNVGARKLAENNQYTGDQKDFMNRIDANKDIRGRIERNDLDAMFGRPPPDDNEERKDEGIDEERREQEQLGGGQGDDEGMDMGEIQPIEGGQNMREIIQDEIERRLIQPRGRWVGNRSVGGDFQRQAMADRVGNGLANSSALRALRKTSIPYNMPSRSYANNSVGLIRNSNKSMILQVNELEP